MTKLETTTETPLALNNMLGEVAYDTTKLEARKEQVYTVKGKFMLSISMTDRAKELLNDYGWEKGKESWIDYRHRTQAERDLEQLKQYKLAADLADAFNRMHGNFA
jgi:hypothetical protein